MEKIYLSIQTSLTIIILVGIFFILIGYLNSKKFVNNNNYIVGDRDENTFSLTASLTASALGAWILFGTASAATWGGIGAVIGYALGTAAPMLFLYNFGPKIRKEFPNGLTLTEFIKKRFGTVARNLADDVRDHSDGTNDPVGLLRFDRIRTIRPRRCTATA